MKKKLHNGKRKRKGVIAEQQLVEEYTSNVSRASAHVALQRTVDSSDPADAQEVDETMIKHLQTTLSMMEERKVSRAEVLALIERMRQRSIAKELEVRYLGGKPKNEPG